MKLWIHRGAFKTNVKIGTRMNDITYKTARDDNGNLIYFENANGWWWRKEFDDRGNCTYHGDASGWWVRHVYNEHNDRVGYENYLGIKQGVLQ